MNWTCLDLLHIQPKEPWNVFQLNEIFEVRKKNLNFFRLPSSAV